MIPVFCRVKNDPETGQWGDCLRACIASIMELEGDDDVPHFAHDNADPEIVWQRMRDFLAPFNLAPFAVAMSGDMTRQQITEFMGEQNPDAYYMLFGQTESGPHVVVCRGFSVAHDPAWVPSSLIGPNTETGVWSIMVLARS